MQVAERNREMVAEFIRVGLLERDPERAADLHMGPYYTQHHPGVRQGREGYVELHDKLFEEHPDLTAEVKRIVADEETVAAHLHLVLDPSAGDPGIAVLDMWRVEDGKLVEHWVIESPVPEGDPVDGISVF